MAAQGFSESAGRGRVLAVECAGACRQSGPGISEFAIMPNQTSVPPTLHIKWCIVTGFRNWALIHDHVLITPGSPPAATEHFRYLPVNFSITKRLHAFEKFDKSAN
jgi:hypothetical protein